MFGVELLLVDVLQRFLQNGGQLVEVHATGAVGDAVLALGHVKGVQVLACSDVHAEVADGQVTHLVDELVFQELPVIHLGFVQIQQEKEGYGYHVTLDFQILDHVNIEKDVPMNLGEAEQNTKNFEVVVVLNILISYISALFAAFETVIIILKVSHDLGEGATLYAHVKWRFVISITPIAKITICPEKVVCISTVRPE